ncbi:MAG: BatA domain-containing protein, partial [Anaerolineae bacterium]|nr:BatA domain-containing protein [Anaerolineae bacterium]
MNTNFQFANPWLLGLLLLIGLLAARHLFSRRGGSPATMTHPAASLTRDLPRSWRVALRPLLTAMRLAAIAMLVIALARPQIVQGNETIKGEGV